MTPGPAGCHRVQHGVGCGRTASFPGKPELILEPWFPGFHRAHCVNTGRKVSVASTAPCWPQGRSPRFPWLRTWQVTSDTCSDGFQDPGATRKKYKCHHPPFWEWEAPLKQLSRRMDRSGCGSLTDRLGCSPGFACSVTADEPCFSRVPILTAAVLVR